MAELILLLESHKCKYLTAYEICHLPGKWFCRVPDSFLEVSTPPHPTMRYPLATQAWKFPYCIFLFAPMISYYKRIPTRIYITAGDYMA
jgi:hypothetical protein